jgi:hypothetical protein
MKLISMTHKNPTLRGLRTAQGFPGALLSLIAKPMLAKQGIVTYAVLSESRPKFVERRAEVRRPVRLQSGKVLNGKDQFLTEFIFRNRTRFGIQLKLATRAALPKLVQLYDDRQGVLIIARVIWQNGGDVGCRVNYAASALNEKLIARLRERYYAVE